MASRNKVETTFHLYSVEKPVWSQVTENHRQRISSIVSSGGWQTIEGNRRGFLNCKLVDDILYGYYAQEGDLRVEQYDEKQQPQEDQQKSFERILFLLFLNRGVLAVQSIRVSRYLDLTGPTVRQSLFNALETTFRQAGLVFDSVQFDRYTREYTREQLIEIFENNSIQRVIIKDLLNESVPANVNLFNPDFNANAFLKAVIDEDLHSTEKVEWIGEEIQRTKIVRGITHAGSPEVIEGVDENGFVREWRPSLPESISLELDTDSVHFPEEDFRRLLELIGRKFGMFSDRASRLNDQRKIGDLPLFGASQED